MVMHNVTASIYKIIMHGHWGKASCMLSFETSSLTSMVYVVFGLYNLLDY
jgi:hypothetical protein